MFSFLKPVFKLILPYLVKYLVVKAEKEITEVKKGADKKAQVIKAVEDFSELSGFNEILNREKLNKLIDSTVAKFIKKI